MLELSRKFIRRLVEEEIEIGEKKRELKAALEEKGIWSEEAEADLLRWADECCIMTDRSKVEMLETAIMVVRAGPKPGDVVKGYLAATTHVIEEDLWQNGPGQIGQ